MTQPSNAATQPGTGRPAESLDRPAPRQQQAGQPADRRDRGVAVYAESFGLPIDELPQAFGERVGSLYAEEAILAAGGPAWSDPALPDRDRSVAVLTALICQGVLGERLDTHLDRAVRHGLDQHALEVLMLLAIYAGQARTLTAAEQINRYFRRRASGS